MSFKLHKQLRESLTAIRKPHHTSAHIAVLECLAYRIDDTKEYCFPSVETIGEESFMSERNARKIIKELEQDGLVQVEPFARKSNRYQLSISDVVFSDFTPDFATSDPATSADVSGLDSRQTVPDSRLTYNSNQSLNPIRESLLSSLKLTPSENLLSEMRSETGKPVEGSNRELFASTEVLKIYSLLMKKVGSTCLEPSSRDVKELSEAVAKYGLPDLYQTIEGIYRQKNKFWRDKMKKATHPCSMLCRSLDTIRQQFAEAEEQAAYWAKKRATDRRSE